VIRERKLIQRRRPLERRKRPGFFRVERPRQLWQLDMTSVWVAEHGWCYLMAIIDCCTREIVAWQLELRCRADEAIAVVERAVALQAIEPGELTLGSDNGSAFTARRFRGRLAELGVRHRRGGYRDPESQAFIESWFGKLKQREVWLNEYETLDDARQGIGGYVDRYHHRPHSSLDITDQSSLKAQANTISDAATDALFDCRSRSSIGLRASGRSRHGSRVQHLADAGPSRRVGHDAAESRVRVANASQITASHSIVPSSPTPPPTLRRRRRC
jgi:transposase-like protein